MKNTVTINLHEVIAEDFKNIAISQNAYDLKHFVKTTYTDQFNSCRVLIKNVELVIYCNGGTPEQVAEIYQLRKKVYKILNPKKR